MKPRRRLLRSLIIVAAFILTVSILYYIFVYAKVYNSSNIKENTLIGSKVESVYPETTVAYLTSPEKRDAGTRGNAEAAQYIRNYFEALGLKPFQNNTYYQRFTAQNLKNSQFKILPVSGEVENVVGKMEGADSSKAVVISAHLDSFDSKGVIDNASGIAALLEAGKIISQRLENDVYPIDIILAAYNAEEIGLLGSEYFYQEMSKEYKDFYNINMDCVGVLDKPLAIQNNHRESENLYRDFGEYFDKYDIPTKDVLYAFDGTEVIGTSDHEIFQNNDRAAIILGEDGLAEIVNTENDNDTSLLDYSEIIRLSNVVADFVLDSGGRVY